MMGMLDMRTQLWRLWPCLRAPVPFFIADGFPDCMDVLGSQRKGSSVAMEVGRSVQRFLTGLAWLPEITCRIGVEARLNFMSSLILKMFVLLRGEAGGSLFRRESVLSIFPGTSRFDLAASRAAFGFGELWSRRDMDRPLLALRGRLFCMLARKEYCWLPCGLVLRA